MGRGVDAEACVEAERSVPSLEHRKVHERDVGQEALIGVRVVLTFAEELLSELV